MVRALWTLLLVAFFGAAALAGEPEGKGDERGRGPHGPPPVEVILKHAAALGLTAEQVAKLEAVAAKMKTPEVKDLLKQLAEAFKAGEREKAKEIREKLKAILGPREEILTEEQREKLRALAEKDGPGEKNGPPGGPGRHRERGGK